MDSSGHASSSNPELSPKAVKAELEPLRRSTSLPRPIISKSDGCECVEGDGQAPKVHEVSRHSPFGALLSRTLPKYTGPYEVGIRDIEVPIPRRTFGTFTHKERPGTKVGIAVDTVLFSLFYPCERQAKPKPVAWFPKYVSITCLSLLLHTPFFRFLHPVPPSASLITYCNLKHTMKC